MQAAVHQNSSHFTPISNASLSPAQAQVIAALAQGHTVTAAAREADVHRTTIHHWLRTEPEFQAAVQNAQSEYVAALNDELRDLSSRALKTLHALLEDPNTPASVRLKAALAVLERPRFPDPGWQLPERIESPQKQEFLDGMAELEANHRAMRMEDALEANQVGRNAPCPCGSERKYKRCCGSAARVNLPAAPPLASTARAASS
ncbi:MAG: motif [Bryobacterales bacterium]|nr:motif [Bryobacterales bacterium]